MTTMKKTTKPSSSPLDTFEPSSYIQNFHPTQENKENYGEVYTPFSLINDMLDILPQEYFSNPDLKWLDPACGCGYFTMIVYHRLMEGLKTKIKNKKRRKKHILHTMLYMIELNPENVNGLRGFFGEDANILCVDFLEWSKDEKNHAIQYDIIIGNPPYNTQGLKKVPTNQIKSKKQDGRTIWGDFVKHSVSTLCENGKLLFIIPSLWMKPDKERMYDFILTHELHKIRCYNNTETKLLFRGQAQTPTCYFLLEKKDASTTYTPTPISISISTSTPTQEKIIQLYDPTIQEYTPYNLQLNEPIPLYGASILKKIMNITRQYGSLKQFTTKTNMPPKHIDFFDSESECLNENGEKSNSIFVNISTTHLTKENTPLLIKKYSTKPAPFYKTKKLILAHKMYGFPFFDREGEYGICNRDNYVIHFRDTQFIQFKQITQQEKEDIFYKVIQLFLSSKLALFIYEATRYRMKYLEKYAFEFIPNILHIPECKTFIQSHISYFSKETFTAEEKTIFMNMVYHSFGLNEEERSRIETLHSKEYIWFL